MSEERLKNAMRAIAIGTVDSVVRDFAIDQLNETLGQAATALKDTCFGADNVREKMQQNTGDKLE